MRGAVRGGEEEDPGLLRPRLHVPGHGEGREWSCHAQAVRGGSRKEVEHIQHIFDKI